jgi:hypothetical protein
MGLCGGERAGLEPGMVTKRDFLRRRKKTAAATREALVFPLAFGVFSSYTRIANATVPAKSSQN